MYIRQKGLKTTAKKLFLVNLFNGKIFKNKLCKCIYINNSFPTLLLQDRVVMIEWTLTLYISICDNFGGYYFRIKDQT